MSTEINVNELANVTVRAALSALANGNRDAWLACFSNESIPFTDDGRPSPIVPWSDYMLFGPAAGRLKHIREQENNGLLIKGDYHSPMFGSFYTAWKFDVKDGKIVRLDVGRA